MENLTKNDLIAKNEQPKPESGEGFACPNCGSALTPNQPNCGSCGVIIEWKD